MLADEVAAYCNYNYIRLTLSKFSARKFQRAKKCIGDIFYQIENSGEVDTSNTPPIAYSRDTYSPTPSSSYGSADSYQSHTQSHQYPQVEPAAQSNQYLQGDYYNF